MPEITRFATIQELSAEAGRVVKVTTKSGSQDTVGLVGSGANRAVIVRGRARDGSTEIQDPQGSLQDGRSLFDVAPQEWVGRGIDVGSLASSRIIEVEEVTDLREVTTFTGLHRRSPQPPAEEVGMVPLAPGGREPPASPPGSRQPPPEVKHVPTQGRAPEAAVSESSSPSAAYVTARAPMPRASSPSPAVTPVARGVLKPRRAQQPLIVAEKPTGPLSLAPRPADPEPERTELESRVLDLEYAAAYLNRIHRQRRVLGRLDRYPELLDRFEAAFSLCTLTVEALSKNLLEEEGV
ncbi:MAG TPA: hypothetical protein VK013_11840 [Myxococcaceae bacterium]|nr:hypothetical protein [Myxococcaceae bacterium]